MKRIDLIKTALIAKFPGSPSFKPSTVAWCSPANVSAELLTRLLGPAQVVRPAVAIAAKADEFSGQSSSRSLIVTDHRLSPRRS